LPRLRLIRRPGSAMKNPWLEIPLADYEGHMALPYVDQARMLAEAFESLLREYRPASVAVIGCAGGNGFERISPVQTKRVVGLDLNPEYITAARNRFNGFFESLELIAGDVQGAAVAFAPVQLIFAGLVFEYVNPPPGTGQPARRPHAGWRAGRAPPAPEPRKGRGDSESLR
jgi:hypothetical protein